jgi:hypothetical protein
MGPSSNLEVLDRVIGNKGGEYSDPPFFLFTVVRNPFDRILSAFRDRVLVECNPSVVDPIVGYFRGTDRNVRYRNHTSSFLFF